MLHMYEAVFISKLTCQLSSFFVQNFVQTTSTLYKERPHFANQRQLYAKNDDNFVRMFTLCTNNVYFVQTMFTLYGQRPRCTDNVHMVRTTSTLYTNNVHIVRTTTWTLFVQRERCLSMFEIFLTLIFF